MGLAKAIPFAAVTFVIAALASMGLPGFSGFVAELQVLIGAWRALPTLAVIAGVGIVIGVAFTLRTLVKAFFGEAAEAPAAVKHHDHAHDLEPISVPERLGAAMLIAVTFIVGIYPRVLLDVIVPAFGSSLFDALRKGGWQ
jgi:NADH-quinone oxidoreductase subunit M